MTENDERSITVESRELRKNFVNPNNVKTEFVNDMLVTHSPNEFFLSFWLTELPIILVQDEFDQLEEVDSILVTKVAVTPKFVKAILEALEINIKKFEEKHEK